MTSGSPPPGGGGRPGPGPVRRWGAAALAALLLALACATASSLRDARGEGTTRFYEADFEVLWEAALRAVRANGLRLDERDAYDRYILATNAPQRGGGMDDERVVVDADQGERIAVFVDSVGPGKWGVEVVTKRAFALDPGKTEWAKDIFYVIERELGDEARLRDAERALPDSAGG